MHAALNMHGDEMLAEIVKKKKERKDGSIW